MEPLGRDDTTDLLLRWREGDDDALERLMPLVYGELARLAHAYLRRERLDHTLETGALIHETYLRLIDQQRVCWRSRAHFVGVSAKMMRRILVDHARSRSNSRRGGGYRRVPLASTREPIHRNAPDLLALEEALIHLERTHPQLGRLVELRYFGGLTSEEIADVQGISIPTVTRRWRAARAWLYRFLAAER